MTLSDTTISQMYLHAIQSYPDECCGIITGSTVTQQVHKCRNIQDGLHESDPMRYPRTARIAYAIDRDEANRIFNDAKSNGELVIAFYHSHPDHDAYFSEEDVEAQTVFGEPEFPGALQVVISVKLGSINEMKIFKWDGKGFEGVKI